MRCPLSVAQCLSCLGDSSTHTGSTDSGEKPRIHTGKSRSKTRNANRQVGDFFFKNSFCKVDSVTCCMKIATDSLRVYWLFRRLWIFLVLYITIPVRDLLSEFKHRLFKICLFLNWAPDHTDFAVDIQVQGERTIARFEVCKCYCVKGGKGSLDYTNIYNHHIKNENKCNG